MTTVRIAQAQINVTVGDITGNAEKIIDYINKAKEAGADIVTFPELAVCGYPPEDLLFRPDFIERGLRAVEEIGNHTDGITAIVGFADRGGGAGNSPDRTYNAAAALSGGKLLGACHKIMLPNYGVFDERRHFAEGSECLFIDLYGARFMLTVCEDIWIPVHGPVDRAARECEFTAVINISASPFHAGKLDERRKLLAGQATRAKAYVFYNNLVGGQDELVFDGGALVIAPDGELVVSAPRFEECLLLADIEVEDKRLSVPEETARPRTLKFIPIEPRKGGVEKRAPALISPELDEIEETYRALVLGTRDYLGKNGFEKALMGLSGGIDSSLTAAIAVDALGPENVIAVTMPSMHTSAETLSDARLLARNLGVRLITLPLKDVYDKYMETLDEHLREGEGGGSATENLQARIRGNYLMALSNRFGWLTLTTGNKSETAVGYCTLYGDTAGGLAVIKDVFKTDVYRLAEYVNKKAGREIIPRSVIDRAPSAELRPDQKDEDSLPPYPMLDKILKLYVEGDKSAEEIVKAGFDGRIVREVVRMVDRAEFKRRQAPPGIKITPKAFGRDRRLPITNRYRPI